MPILNINKGSLKYHPSVWPMSRGFLNDLQPKRGCPNFLECSIVMVEALIAEFQCVLLSQRGVSTRKVKPKETLPLLKSTNNDVPPNRKKIQRKPSPHLFFLAASPSAFGSTKSARPWRSPAAWSAWRTAWWCRRAAAASCGCRWSPAMSASSQSESSRVECGESGEAK